MDLKLAKYKFSQAERYAVFTVHKGKCYMCSQPINLQSMQIDHVIPEKLLDNPSKLGVVLNKFGLPKDFNLNGFGNWLPSCKACNGSKLEHVFEPSPLIQLHLERAVEKMDTAKEFAAKTVKKAQVSKALNTLFRLDEAGELNDEIRKQLQPLVDEIASDREPEEEGEPIRLTALYEVVSEDQWRKVVKGPYGVGARPVGDHVSSDFDCPNCGSIAAWSGARCVICGQLNDE